MVEIDGQDGNVLAASTCVTKVAPESPGRPQRNENEQADETIVLMQSGQISIRETVRCLWVSIVNFGSRW